VVCPRQRNRSHPGARATVGHWEGDLNENTNGLLRQYFPYGTDLSVFTQTELDVIAQKRDNTPRKALGYSTPSMQFVRTVAITD